MSEVIKGVIRGRELPFPEQRADPCNSGNILPNCPLKKGQTYQFKASFEVKPFYPPVSKSVFNDSIVLKTSMIWCVFLF